MLYRGFKIVHDDYGYHVFTNSCDSECGLFHTYNEVVSVIDRYYSYFEV